MKLTELFEAAAPKHPLIEMLKGKIFSYEEMIKFLKSSPLFEQKGSLWVLAPDADVNIRPVFTALKKACGPNVSVSISSKAIAVDWNWAAPLNATVMLDQVVFDREKDNMDAVKKYESDSFAWGVDHAKGTGGGKGWFVSHTDAPRTITGRFDEGPMKGDMFRVASKPGAAAAKKGDKIKVVVTDVTYGKVKLG